MEILTSIKVKHTNLIMLTIEKSWFPIFLLALLLPPQSNAQDFSPPAPVEQDRFKRRQVSSLIETISRDGEDVERTITVIDRDGKPTQRHVFHTQPRSQDFKETISTTYSYDRGILVRCFTHQLESDSYYRQEYQYDSSGRLARMTILGKEKNTPGWMSLWEERWVFDPDGNSVVHIIFEHDVLQDIVDWSLTVADTGMVDYSSPGVATRRKLAVRLYAYEYRWNEHLRIKRLIPGMDMDDGNPDTVVLFHAEDDGYVSDSAHVRREFDTQGYLLKEWQYGKLSTVAEYRFNEQGLVAEAMFRDIRGAILQRRTYDYQFY
jgi:hypothetical protein